MTFPPPNVVDNFTRGDESPAVGWTDGPDGTAYGGVKILTNRLAPISGDSWDYWSAQQYGPDCSSYITWTAVSGTVEIDFCLSPIGSASVDGYFVKGSSVTSLITIGRTDNNASTTLGATIAQTIVAGDSLGIERRGSTIDVWYRVGSGAWTLVGTRDDATYIQAGYMGPYMSNANERLSAFAAWQPEYGRFDNPSFPLSRPRAVTS